LYNSDSMGLSPLEDPQQTGTAIFVVNHWWVGPAGRGPIGIRIYSFGLLVVYALISIRLFSWVRIEKGRGKKELVFLSKPWPMRREVSGIPSKRQMSIQINGRPALSPFMLIHLYMLTTSDPHVPNSQYYSIFIRHAFPVR